MAADVVMEDSNKEGELDIDLIEIGADVGARTIHEDVVNEPSFGTKQHNAYMCSNCYKIIPFGKHLMCRGCHRVPYCSPECGVTNWFRKVSGHRQFCDIYKSNQAPGIIGKDLIRVIIAKNVGSGLFVTRTFNAFSNILIERPILRNKAEFEAKQKYNTEASKVIPKDRLLSKEGSEKIQNELAILQRKYAASEAQCMDIVNLFTEKKLLLERSRCGVSAIELSAYPKPDSGEIGFDLCFGLSYINHSCNPNCYIHSDGIMYYLVALRDIKPGEQLTYRYHDPFIRLFDLGMTREIYWGRLRNIYRIECPKTCLCKTSVFWKVHKKVISIYGKLSKAGEVIFVMNNLKNTPDMTKIVKGLCRDLFRVYSENTSIIPPYFLYRVWISVRDTLYKIGIGKEQINTFKSGLFVKFGISISDTRCEKI